MNSDSNKRYGSDEHMDDDALADAMDQLQEDDQDDDREEDELEEEEAEEEEVDETVLLKAEIADLKERYIRLAADMENLRRRTEREVKDARIFAISNFARDVLSVSDDLSRAMQVVRDSQNTEDPLASVAGLVEGIAATERAMITTMERHGVTRVDPVGEKFDPNYHQAMFEVPDATKPNNTVMNVVQAGFKIGERMLRPALVGVSKGGPKA
jgi:molecular chaperone GrpE